MATRTNSAATEMCELKKERECQRTRVVKSEREEEEAERVRESDKLWKRRRRKYRF